MAPLRLDAQFYPATPATQRRYRFSLITVVFAVLLISWGGLVTSIDAGLAVPDWPTSFGSLDPFNTGFADPNDPGARWWDRLPILAEHGHRLVAALVGLLTLVLALWTWRADPRGWMRRLGFAALGLVVFQGVLGGLRVVWVSLDLAVVHACVAQIFFALLVAMALFTSKGWLRAETVLPRSPQARRLRVLAVAAVAALYVQIILGALLRHPGTGVHPVFAGVHVTGAFVVIGLALATFSCVRTYFGHYRLLNRAAWSMLGAVATQVVLGFSALLVLVVETQLARRSVAQVVLSSSHLVVGALLMAAAVSLALLSLRSPAARPAAPEDAALLTPPLPTVGP